MKVTVARVGRANGLKGDVALDVRTDIPEQRLVVGAQFETEPAQAGPLTVSRVRQQSGRWIVGFEEVADRTAAESITGVDLVIDADGSDEDDAWFVHELVGLAAVRPDGSDEGEVIGEVVDLLDMPAPDVLVVRQPDGFRAMIPFIEAFVPEVDVEGGRVIVTPPYGLLSGEEPENTGETAGGAGSDQA